MKSKSAAVELIKSQAEAASLYINGKPATAAQLKADFERRFDLPLDNFNNLMYAANGRKNEDTPYLNKLISFLLGRKKRLRK